MARRPTWAAEPLFGVTCFRPRTFSAPRLFGVGPEAAWHNDVVRCAVTLVMVVMGCGGSSSATDASPDAVPLSRLAIDVRLTPSVAVIYIQDLDRNCDCTIGNWPAPGECEGDNDGIFCSCDAPGTGEGYDFPGSCLASIRLERDGVVLAETTYQDSLPQWFLQSDEFYSGPGLEMVFDGCGGSARVPLPASAPPVTTVERVATTSQHIWYDWADPRDANDSFLHHGNGLGGAYCHEFTPGTTVVAVPAVFPRDGLYTTFAALIPEDHDTQLGPVHVWTGSSHVANHLRKLTKQENGEWSWQPSAGDATYVDATYNGMPMEWWLHDVAFDMSGPEPLIRLRSEVGIDLTYEAGPVMDTITTHNNYSAQVPHVAMPGLGSIDGIRVQLNIPPTTMTSATGMTYELTLVVDATLDVIAYPLDL